MSDNRSTRRGFLTVLAALPLIGKVMATAEAAPVPEPKATATIYKGGGLWLDLNTGEMHNVECDMVHMPESAPEEFKRKVQELSVRRAPATYIKLPDECWEILSQEDIGE